MNDHVAGSQSATINGLVGYSMYNWASSETSRCGQGPQPFLSNYGYGPFVLGDGNYLQPTSAKEKSALRAGLNGDFTFCNGVIPAQEIQFMPYGQTDFRAPTAGTAAVAFSYTQGTDPTTFVKQNIYKVSLKVGF